MRINFLGVGEMGSALARAAVAAGHDVTVWNRNPVRSAGFDRAAERLTGAKILNLTTTSPAGARELSTWASALGAHYLGGGIMATPEMIGTPQSRILYSGAREVFDEYRSVLERWGDAEYFGADAGMASLYDLALLSAMYAMFAGFFHGAAMAATAGLSAADFAAMAVPWLQVTAEALPEFAEIDAGHGAEGFARIIEGLRAAA